jgi:hypothetical protein
VKNIKMVIKGIGLEGVDYSYDSEWGSVARFCENGNEPSGSIKLWQFLDQVNNY